MELGLPNLGVNSQGAAGGTVITTGSPLFSTGGWTVIGTAVPDSETAFTVSGTTGEGLHKNFLTVGRRYRVDVTWSKTSGASNFQLNNSTSSADMLVNSTSTSSSATVIFTAQRTMLYFRLGNVADTLTVTNFTVVEY